MKKNKTKMESASVKIEKLCGRENLCKNSVALLCVYFWRKMTTRSTKEICVIQARKRFLKADETARKLTVTAVERKPVDLFLRFTFKLHNST